ncbi:hypothetical protein CFC21_062898 [Triticum aestivum]|uniref:F-box domain-containing protein n=4 Tax=Triticinae TaxID=1648030 RepID=A0A9R1KIJ6_WHEAT|nr:uncharacterized protein LOC109775920 [Aegilops tauschii subsp. strangulata]KAF7055359.1 hypothetical protein CFC21_062898 [Triticum aestivum]
MATSLPPPLRSRRTLELPDDVMEEIFLRLPADNPASLARVAGGCKSWLAMVSDPNFAPAYRRLRDAPPMLGFLYNYRYTDEGAPYWTSHFRAAAALPPRVRRDRKHWRALDSRHGLVLFDTPESDGHLVVSDLVTGEHWKIDGHITFPDACNATVLCARDGCDHRDCHGGPFLVACVDSVVAGDRRITCAMFYSSVTGKWIDPIFVEQPNVIDARGHSAVLGNKVYVPCVKDGSVVEYNTRENKLSVIKAPFEVQDQKIELMGVEDGMLLFASVVKPRLYLWSMEAGPRGAAGRAQSRFIELGPLLPRPVLVDNTEVSAVGFAEGVGVIFIKTKVGLYTIHLKSKQSNQVHRGYINKVMPYMSFYTGAWEPLPASDEA